VADPRETSAARESPRRTSRRRELAFRAFALGVGLAGGVVCVELLARLVLTDFYTCDPAVGWSFEPGKAGFKVDRRLEYAVHTRINSAGFHDLERSLEKPPGTERVVLLGDSMLAGMQVPLEQSLAHRLEAFLNESGAGEARYEVVNCATDGYGTAQAWLLYLERCRRYQPDLVLLGFFASNDVLDNYWDARALNHPLARKCGRAYFELRDGRLARVADGPLGASASASAFPLLQRSYLYQLLAPPPEPEGEGSRMRANAVFRSEYGPELLEAWEVTRELLLALDRDVRRSGARFGVLLLPSRFEVDPARAGQQAKGPMDYARPHQLLAEFLDAERLAHLDLAPGLRDGAAHPDSAPLYFRRDMHWTPRGNDLAGALVARWIAESYSSASGSEAASAAGPAALPAPDAPAPESSSTTGPPPEPRSEFGISSATEPLSPPAPTCAVHTIG
jgi:hypothetical protein